MPPSAGANIARLPPNNRPKMDENTPEQTIEKYQCTVDDLKRIRNRDECPKGRGAFTACLECECTTQIGFCAYPLKINKEIEAGHALPPRHSHFWPELLEDFRRRAYAAAYTKASCRK